jgi:IS5 family transposase
MFKVVFLQFLYDLSDYRIEEELNDRLSFKMFVGLDVEETPPDHSVISRFRDRLGPQAFKDIFNRVVNIARSKGLVSDKLHIIDSTDVKAKVDLYRLKKEHKDDEPDSYIDNHSPDKDARPGRKHKGVQFYGYKAHCVMDAQSEIIVNTDTTPGNVKDLKMLRPLTESSPPPNVITADKGYDCQDNHKYLSGRRIRNGIILKSNHTRKYLASHVKRISNIAKAYRALIEHKLADLKKHHGLRTARYWGTVKLRIQTYMTAMCANIKRMAKLLFFGISPPEICLRRASA